jgi:hypothetical protein
MPPVIEGRQVLALLLAEPIFVFCKRLKVILLRLRRIITVHLLPKYFKRNILFLSVAAVTQHVLRKIAVLIACLRVRPDQVLHWALLESISWNRRTCRSGNRADLAAAEELSACRTTRKTLSLQAFSTK